MATVCIVEREEPCHHWELQWPEGYVTPVKTAVAALQAVRDRDAALVAAGAAIAVTAIEWTTCSSVGRSVVLALADAKKGK